MNDQQINQIITEAEEVARGNYKEHEPTARNHARLQASLVKINGELIKTIRSLDQKNSKLQKQVAILTIVATVAAIIALFK